MSIDQMDINLKNSTNFSTQGGYAKYSRPSDNFVFGDVPNTVHEKGNIIGELFDTKGDQLILDNFSTISSNYWATIGDMTVKRREATVTSVSNSNTQLVQKDGTGGAYYPMQVSTSYRIQFEVISTNVDSLSLRDTQSSTFIKNGLVAGMYDFVYTTDASVASNVYFYSTANSGESFSIKNFSIQEITSIEFPEAPTANLEGLGNELITNGTFNSDLSGWVLSSNTAITQVDGRAKIVCSDGNNQNLYQEISINPGVTVKVTFDYEHVSGNGGKINLSGDNFVGIWNNTANGLDSSYTTGSITHYYTNNSNSLQNQKFQFMNEGNGTIYFDNISIKEVTGLKTTKPYSIGDMIVLDRAGYNVGTPLNSSIDPLETFSTFGLDIASAINTTGYGICYWDMSGDLVEGNEYFLTFDFTLNSGTAPMLNFADDTTGLIDRTHFSEGEMSTGSYTVAFTYKATERYVGFRNSAGVSADYSVTNVKFIDKNEIYQATRNIVDMYDIKTDTSTTYDFKKGFVYYLNSPSAEGIQGHYYLCHNGDYPSRPASSTYFNNEIYFKDLGTANGYDFAPTLGSDPILYKTGVIVYIADASITAGATSGHYYKVISGTNIYFNTGVVNFNTGWQDLGTDINGVGNFMSLQNPYFKVQDKVFRYDIAFHRIHKTTKALDTKIFCSFADGIGGWNSHSNDEVAMQDLFDISTNNSIQLNKVIGDKNAYEDNDYFYIMIGEVPRLNQGAYHPVYNSFGTRSFRSMAFNNEVRVWHANTTISNIHSIANTFDNLYLSISTSFGTGSIKSPNGNKASDASQTLNTRPDGLFYDKIYPENFNGFTDRRIFTGKYDYNQILSMAKEIQKDRKEAKQVIFCNVNNMLSGSTYLISSNSYETIYLNNNENLNETMPDSRVIKVGDKVDFIFINGDTTIFIKGRVIEEDSNGNWFRVDNELKDSSKFGTYTSGAFYYISTNNVSTSQSITHIDVIGDINNYPKDWMKYLNEGKYINFKPLLINQKGEDIIPDGQNIKENIMSKKCKKALDWIITNNNGDSYSSVDLSIIDSIKDMTNSHTFKENTNHIALPTYVADADPLKEDREKRIKVVVPEVIGSNSHLVSKHSDIVRVIGEGFIPTGDRLKKNTLTNTDVYGTPIKASAGTFEWLDGTDMEIDVDIAGSYKGTVIRRNYGDKATTDWSTFMTETTLNNFSEKLLDVGVSQLPEHVAINLDNGKGAKWYNALAIDNQELFLQVHGKTIVNENGDDGVFDESTRDWYGNKIKNGRFNMRLPFRIKE